MFGITVVIFDITVVFLLDLFCIVVASQNQMERRVKGNNTMKECKEARIVEQSSGKKQRSAR
jgi:hypothetical protein